MKIADATQQDYQALITLWEAAVRATHAFLPEEEIMQLKPKILHQYFDAVVLKCVKTPDDTIIGFSGVADHKLEMLFVAPEAQGQGVGSALCQYAITQQAVSKVDVNEQNPAAKVFYEKMGFKIVARSELDAQGKPYPILHMAR